MKLFRTKAPALLIAVAAFVVALSSWALEPNADGWFHTGSGVRVKTVVLVDVKVYEINHFMKKLPDSKSKRAVIDLDAEKKITWKMLRDVDAEKIQTALRDAFKMNGYSDAGKINAFLGAFKSELKENAKVTISYNSEKKTTTVNVAGGGSATVEGVDFMKGVWSIWFGQIDQPKLGDAMISKL
jgi:hypothetical protein